MFSDRLQKTRRLPSLALAQMSSVHAGCWLVGDGGGWCRWGGWNREGPEYPGIQVLQSKSEILHRCASN